MYWDINFVKERLEKRLPNFLIKQEEGEMEMLLFNSGGEYFTIIFSTAINCGFGLGRRKSMKVPRIIKCNDKGEAREVAKAMLGEEVEAQETLDQIKTIRQTTPRDFKEFLPVDVKAGYRPIFPKKATCFNATL